MQTTERRKILLGGSLGRKLGSEPHCVCSTPQAGTSQVTLIAGRRLRLAFCLGDLEGGQGAPEEPREHAASCNYSPRDTSLPLVSSLCSNPGQVIHWQLAELGGGEVQGRETEER